MYCVRCGLELASDARFCSRCGARTEMGRAVNSGRPFMLDKANKKIAGVCAGFARYLDLDVTLVRVLWLAFAIGTGVGFLAYLAAWIIMPSDYGYTPRPVVANPQATS